MIGFDEAIAIIVEEARPIRSEQVALDAVHRQVLAADVIALIDSPRCDVSSMDGYAVREADLACRPARLRIVGENFPGQRCSRPLAPGECARIFTGGGVPVGADRVVVQEVVEREGDWALFTQSLTAERYIRPAASDFAAGQRLLTAGTPMSARAIVAAAAADCATVAAWARPRFVVLGTGDELTEPGTARDAVATIPDSVSLGVAATGAEWGGQSIRRERLPDQPALLAAAAARALDEADVIVVTGGASVGERDFARSMFGTGLELLFSRIAIKPGKPVWFGRAAGKLVLGLPGNPTSAMVTARLFLAPLIAGLAGRDPRSALRWVAAALVSPLGSCGERETFARGRWDRGRVAVLGNQDSGAQQALVAAELLVRRRVFAPPLAADDSVEVLAF